MNLFERAGRSCCRKPIRSLLLLLVVCLISLALSVYMTVISIQFTITQFEGGNTSIAIAIPIWVIYLSTCIGFFLMSYVYLRKLGSLLKKKAAQETGEEEAAC